MASSSSSQSLVQAYLKPLLEKHEKEQILTYEDLMAAWQGVQDRLQTTTKKEKAHVTALHEGQLQAYQTAATTALQAWADTVPLPALDASFGSSADAYVSHCLESLTPTFVWRVNAATMRAAVETRLKERARATLGKQRMIQTLRQSKARMEQQLQQQEQQKDNKTTTTNNTAPSNHNATTSSNSPAPEGNPQSSGDVPASPGTTAVAETKPKETLEVIAEEEEEEEEEGEEMEDGEEGEGETEGETAEEDNDEETEEEGAMDEEVDEQAAAKTETIKTETTKPATNTGGGLANAAPLGTKSPPKKKGIAAKKKAKTATTGGKPQLVRAKKTNAKGNGGAANPNNNAQATKATRRRGNARRGGRAGGAAAGGAK